WTTLAPMTLANGEFLFSYMDKTGAMQIGRLNPGGRGLTETWRARDRPGWTSVFAVRMAGQPHILMYRARDGLAVAFRVGPNGAGMGRVWQGWFRSGCSQMVPITMDRTVFLLCYRPNGQTMFGRIGDRFPRMKVTWLGNLGGPWNRMFPFVRAGATY